MYSQPSSYSGQGKTVFFTIIIGLSIVTVGFKVLQYNGLLERAEESKPPVFELKSDEEVIAEGKLRSKRFDMKSDAWAVDHEGKLEDYQKFYDILNDNQDVLFYEDIRYQASRYFGLRDYNIILNDGHANTLKRSEFYAIQQEEREKELVEIEKLKLKIAKLVEDTKPLESKAIGYEIVVDKMKDGKFYYRGTKEIAVFKDGELVEKTKDVDGKTLWYDGVSDSWVEKELYDSLKKTRDMKERYTEGGREIQQLIRDGKINDQMEVIEDDSDN